MPTEYKKGVKTNLSPHFFTSQFDCLCKYPECKVTLIEPDLVDALEEFWDICKGFHITSGFRCVHHNEDIKGVADSQHLFGKAADCKSLLGYNGNLLTRYAEQVELFRKGGIGIAENWVHLDIRQGPARWAYPLKC